MTQYTSYHAAVNALLNHTTRHGCGENCPEAIALNDAMLNACRTAEATSAVDSQALETRHAMQVRAEETMGWEVLCEAPGCRAHQGWFVDEHGAESARARHEVFHGGQARVTIVASRKRAGMV